MEYESYRIGDAGFIALFDNGLITNDEWVCHPFYIAPLDNPALVRLNLSGQAILI